MLQRVVSRSASSFCASIRSGVSSRAGLELAVRRDVLIERHLIRPVAPPPEPMAIPRLVDRDPIDPGAQARLAAEPMDGAEDAQEDFLRQIERFVAIAEQVHGQLDDHALVLGHQLCTGGFVAASRSAGPARLPGRQRPTNRRPAPASRQIHYTKVRPRIGDAKFHAGLVTVP